MNDWISAAIAVGAGLVVGAIGARLIRNAISRANSEAVRSAAAPASSLVFSSVFLIGLIVGLGFVHPESLDTIPDDLVDFLPRAVAGAIVVIAGNVAASLAHAAAHRALRGSGSAERFGPAVVRWTILGFAIILGAAQLGIDTTIINIAVAALVFGLAASMALLVGLGGRRVAGEIAAGRAWRTSLTVGDHVKAVGLAGGDLSGTVIEIHPTTLELDCDGRSVLVPNSQLLDVVIERTRPAEHDD